MRRFRNVFISISLCLVGTMANCQSINSQGIEFRHYPNLNDVFEKAKAQNKLVFIDCYTTWCAPCKFMSDSIFTSPIVGDFVNSQFISIKVQMDSSLKDSEKVKEWYQEARLINERYRITMYPTYLILLPNGRLAKRSVGMRRDPKDFNAILADALEFPKLVEKYQPGITDTGIVKKLLTAVIENGDTVFVKQLLTDFLARTKDIYTRENLYLIGLSITSSADTSFQIFRNNIDLIDRIQMLKGYAIRFLSPVVNNEEIKPRLSKNISWRVIEKTVIKKYPDIGGEIVLLQHFDHDRKTGNWEAFGQNAMRYMEKYSARRGDAEFTGIISWSAFEHCTNKKVLRAALKWSMQSIRISEASWNLDTYACLLYKLGKTGQAKIWMKKAIVKAPSDKELQGHLEKMEKGIKFWES